MRSEPVIVVASSSSSSSCSRRSRKNSGSTMARVGKLRDPPNEVFALAPPCEGTVSARQSSLVEPRSTNNHVASPLSG
jgi:hypothetical protein